MTIGPFSVLPGSGLNTDGDGYFTASIVIPELTPGNWTLTAVFAGLSRVISLTVTQ